VPKNPLASDLSAAPVFVKGQLWKFDTRCIRIEHVGRLLVEHRGISLLEQKRSSAPKRMMAIKELQAFMAANHAVLVVN
jgi:hypothetical protein